MAEGWGHLQLGKWLCSASSVSAVVAWTVTSYCTPISWCHLETGHPSLTGTSKENMHATKALVTKLHFIMSSINRSKMRAVLSKSL